MKSCNLYENPTAPVYLLDGSGGTAYYFDGIPSPYKNPVKFSAASD